MRIFPIWTAIALVAAALASPSFAAELTGPAHVLDTDSIAIAGEQIQLFGIDAIETACIREGKPHSSAHKEDREPGCPMQFGQSRQETARGGCLLSSRD